MKKLKILVSLFSIFSLFLLTNVGAMEKNNKDIENEEYRAHFYDEEYEDVFDNKNLFKALSINNNSINNNIIYENEWLYNSSECSNNNDFSLEINQNELEWLSEKFSEDLNFNNTNNIFVEIMRKFGIHMENPSLKECVYKFIPFRFMKIKKSENPEKYVAKLFDFRVNKKSFLDGRDVGFEDSNFEGEDQDLFVDFYKKSFNLSSSSSYFGISLLKIFRQYYRCCFPENLNSPIVVLGSNNEKYEISREELENNLNFLNNNLTNDVNILDFRTKKFAELINMFLTQLYLKSLFISKYYKNYNFYDREGEPRKELIRFSEICSRALRCEFDEKGFLKTMKLDFNSAAKDFEDEKFLKRLYDAIYNEKEDSLLYNLYVATLEFLKNKEFWNKMFGIIHFLNKGFENSPYFKLTCDANSFEDYDFPSLHERFKYIFLMLPKNGKKGFFNEKKYNLGKKPNSAFVNFFDFKEEEYDFDEDEKSYVEEFNNEDNILKANLELYFNNRFRNTFTISSDFKWIVDVFDCFCKENSNFKFKLLNSGDFFVSENYMLEYLNCAVQNETVKEECFSFIRFLFKMYLTKGFITAYGNKADETNSSIKKLEEYFYDKLDLRFEKNNFGKYTLKLNIKKDGKLNYSTREINRIIRKFNNKKTCENVTEYEKMVYRIYLSVIAFVKEENFFNKFLAFLVFNHGFNVSKNTVSANNTLYKEYKSINSKFSKG